MNETDLTRMIELLLDALHEMLKCENIDASYYLSDNEAAELDNLIEKYKHERNRLTKT